MARRVGSALNARIAAFGCLLFLLPGIAPARESGQVREVRADAERLLAQGARSLNADPKAIVISDAVVAGDQALLSYDIGTTHGIMALVRQENRWWDAFDATRAGEGCWNWQTAFPLPPSSSAPGASGAAAAILLRGGLSSQLIAATQSLNAGVRDMYWRACAQSVATAPVRVVPPGAALAPPRNQTNGYAIAVTLGAISEPAPMALYARAPTAAEFLPWPAGYEFTSNAVCYFDLIVQSNAPVTFPAGTAITIWFPFVLDDTLQYDLTMGFTQPGIGPLYARPFDNALRYTLPAFTVAAGRTVMAEIDGDR